MIGTYLLSEREREGESEGGNGSGNENEDESSFSGLVQQQKTGSVQLFKLETTRAGSRNDDDSGDGGGRSGGPEFQLCVLPTPSPPIMIIIITVRHQRKEYSNNANEGNGRKDHIAHNNNALRSLTLFSTCTFARATRRFSPR